jgi:type II secretory pathway pseudopilin PulG
MISTLLFRQLRAATRQLGRSHAGVDGCCAANHSGPGIGAGGSEAGFTLIEVIVSALLVAFIAIATFNGFDVVGRVTVDQRHHDEAAVLAAESQEQLRTDSADTLDGLQNTAHTFTETVGQHTGSSSSSGETFTVTQTAKWVNDSNQSVPCSATGKESNSNQNGSYLQITSTVTWPQLSAAGRPAVSQSSIITPPDGSGLEVDVTNGATPLQPVGGASALANSTELTTGEAGCVIFGAIPATKVNVEVKKIGDVTPTGAWRKVTKELLITPNVTTHYPVTLAPGGRIKAEFEWEGKKVNGDTFVVSNNNMNETPDFEVGGVNNFSYNSEGEYEPVNGTPGAYGTVAVTPINTTFYPTGNLFPFENAWSAYSGDCPENNPTVFKIEGGSVKVKPGESTSVTVPMSHLALTVYENTRSSSTKNLLKTGEYEVKITNTGCSSYLPPNNASKANLIHKQFFKEGALEAPYQPFGKFELCLANKTAKKIYTTTYTNETAAGTARTFYLAQKTGESGGGTEFTVTENRTTC